MTAPATHPTTPPVSALLRLPANAFEWALAAVLWPLALAAPVALGIGLWPVLTSGAFGPLVFGLGLALGFVISAFSLWLFTPLAWLTAGLAAGLLGTLRWLWHLLRLLRRP